MPHSYLDGVKYEFPEQVSERPTQSQVDVLDRTIRLVPFYHRTCFSKVQARRPSEEPQRGGGHNIAERIIRLSHHSFAQTYNQRFSVTMLHELGHLVDHAFQITAWVRRQHDNPAAQALLQTGHRGATHGPGETIADCYMVYLLNVVGNAGYTHPPAPHSYRGAEAQRRFAVLLASPAFRGSAIQL